MRQEQNLNSSEFRFGVLGALIIHSVIFWKMPYTQVRYDVRPAFSAMEVNLVSGMKKADPVVRPVENVVHVKPVKPSHLDEKITVKEPESVKKQNDVPVKQIQEARISEQIGGQKQAVNSKSGAVIKARPMIYYNPAPSYPYIALERGYEGEVVLVVAVNKNGAADKVEIAHSSGYGMLDASAVKTVKKWKFEPAKVFGLPVDSEIEVPIKFEIAAARGRSG